MASRRDILAIKLNTQGQGKTKESHASEYFIVWWPTTPWVLTQRGPDSLCQTIPEGSHLPPLRHPHAEGKPACLPRHIMQLGTSEPSVLLALAEMPYLTCPENSSSSFKTLLRHHCHLALSSDPVSLSPMHEQRDPVPPTPQGPSAPDLACPFPTQF